MCEVFSDLMNQNVAFILAVHILNPNICLFSLINCLFFPPLKDTCSALPSILQYPHIVSNKDCSSAIHGLRPHLSWVLHCMTVGGGDGLI